MAKIKIDTIAEAVYEASKDATPTERTHINENVIILLKKNKLLKEYKKLLTKIKEYENKEEGILYAVIKSARPLEEKSHAEIVHFLKHYYNKTKVETEEIIDEKTIGGVHIKVADEVIDLTLRSKLSQLQTTLLKH